MTDQDQRDVDREMLMSALNIQSSLAVWALAFSSGLKDVVVLLALIFAAQVLICAALVALVLAH